MIFYFFFFYKFWKSLEIFFEVQDEKWYFVICLLNYIYFFVSEKFLFINFLNFFSDNLQLLFLLKYIYFLIIILFILFLNKFDIIFLLMIKEEIKDNENEKDLKENNEENSSLILENELVIENEDEPSENYSFLDFINYIESYQPRNIDKFENTEIKESLITEANENRIIKTELVQINSEVIFFLIFYNRIL